MTQVTRSLRRTKGAHRADTCGLRLSILLGLGKQHMHASSRMPLVLFLPRLHLRYQFPCGVVAVEVSSSGKVNVADHSQRVQPIYHVVMAAIVAVQEMHDSTCPLIPRGTFHRVLLFFSISWIEFGCGLLENEGIVKSIEVGALAPGALFDIAAFGSD